MLRTRMASPRSRTSSWTGPPAFTPSAPFTTTPGWASPSRRPPPPRSTACTSWTATPTSRCPRPRAWRSGSPWRGSRRSSSWTPTASRSRGAASRRSPTQTPRGRPRARGGSRCRRGTCGARSSSSWTAPRRSRRTTSALRTSTAWASGAGRTTMCISSSPTPASRSSRGTTSCRRRIRCIRSRSRYTVTRRPSSPGLIMSRR
mmetsp:Transcript_56202/g.171181  ORF Transcript_56202/g.171181 Transcript_56202/m.171181 type:complete len:203 (-) Transcript_56202:5999-6607(-)